MKKPKTKCKLNVTPLTYTPLCRSEQKKEKLVPVSGHRRAGQRQGIASLRRPHAPRVALGATAVLVLVRFVGDEQVERALWQVALDELGRLVATLTASN